MKLVKSLLDSLNQDPASGKKILQGLTKKEKDNESSNNKED